MSQRQSGYERKALDFYATPAWVTESMLGFIQTRPGSIWEPAAGNGQMVRILTERFLVLATDVAGGVDFLAAKTLPDPSIRGICTNPPYKDGAAFCEQALRLTKPFGGFVAMLLRVDFDSGRTRAHLFADCPAWSRKIVLTQRIKWFDGPVPCRPCGASGKVDGQKCRPCKGAGQVEHSPSENHAWFLWDWSHAGPAVISYAP